MALNITHAARRARQTVADFEHPGRLLLDLAASSLGQGSEELTFTSKSGGRITIPNVPGARVPIYEIFAEDEYRIGWFTDDLAASPDGLVVLDVGAHVGCFTVAVATRHAGARVHSYEASPSTAAYLRRNVDDNGLQDRVAVNDRAVQAVAGSLLVADNGAASGHNGVLHLGEGGREVEVPSVSMREALFASGRSADLVKMDTEGGEYDMVLGSDPADWSDVKRVVMEYHDLPGHDWSELETFFAAAGLKVVDRSEYTDRLGMAWLSRDPLPAAR